MCPGEVSLVAWGSHKPPSQVWLLALPELLSCSPPRELNSGGVPTDTRAPRLGGRASLSSPRCGSKGARAQKHVPAHGILTLFLPFLLIVNS